MSGQRNGGGWPSTSGNPSGGGRSNNASHKGFVLKDINKLKETRQDTDGATIEVVKHVATFGCPTCLQNFTSTSTKPDNFITNKSHIVKAHEKRCNGPPPPSAEPINDATHRVRVLEDEKAQLRKQNVYLAAKLESVEQHKVDIESMHESLVYAVSSLEKARRGIDEGRIRLCAALKCEAKATLATDLETQRRLYASLHSATNDLYEKLDAHLTLAKAWLPSIYGAKKLLDAATLLKKLNPQRPEFEASMNGWSNQDTRSVMMDLYDACSANVDTHFNTTTAQEATNVIATAASSTDNNLALYNAGISTITSTAHPSIAPSIDLKLAIIVGEKRKR